MMFTSPMRLLAAVALDTDSDAVAKELLRLGTLDMVSIKELSGEWTSKLGQAEPRVNLARLGELRKRVEGFLAMAVPPIPRPVLGEAAAQSAATVNLDEVEKRLDAIAADVSGLRERQKALQDEILRLEEIGRQVGSFDDLKAGAAASSTYSFLSIKAGMLPSDRVAELSAALEGMPSVVLPSAEGQAGDSGVVLVFLKKDAARVEPILERLGWEDARLPDSAGKGGKEEALREIDTKIAGFRAKQSAASAELQDYLSLKGQGLAELWSALRVEELVARVRSSFSRTSRTVLFSGWIPETKVAAVESGIRKAAVGGCSIEWIKPGTGEASDMPVPVEMDNPEVLKPFEGLVRNYAVPEYGSVDPTPFVAVAYLLMFGLMFGDVGHGLVVGLVGLAGTLLAKKSGKPDGLYRLMMYCGGAAMVAGALFGSYFGMELLPPLWFNYHAVVNGEGGSGTIRSIYDILGITIRFGMAVMGVGLVINWVNLIRKREWLTLALDKAGLLGGWIYGAGSWVAFYFVAHDYKGLPPSSLLVPMLGLPTLVLAFKGPIEFVAHAAHEGKHFKPGMIMDFFMEWIVEVLEIYSGYLANTLSFMRVAGLGIAHVSLMTAFFQIARMVSPKTLLSPAAIAILLLGNVLVIALEGLSAGIQSLRLNYYEFFSKYFNGTGKAYRPISLNSKE